MNVLEGFAMLIALSHIAHASDALSSMREAQENSCPSLGGPLHAKRSFEKLQFDVADNPTLQARWDSFRIARHPGRTAK
jgi:hypothetical protein